MDDIADACPVFMTFRLGETLLALPLDLVEEVIGPRPLSVLPDAPAPVLGALRLRGERVVVLDLARFLGREPQTPTHDARLLVLRPEAGLAGPRVALRVDQVVGVEQTQEEQLTPLAQTTLLQGL